MSAYGELMDSDKGIEKSTEMSGMYGSLMDDEVEVSRKRAALAVAFSSSNNSEQAAWHADVAKKYQTTPEVVAQFPDQFKEDMARQNADDLFKQFPKLRDHIAEYPQRAAVSKDDLHNLSGIERTFAQSAARQVAGPFRALAAGVLTDFNAAAWGTAETGAGLVGADAAKAYFSGLRKGQEAMGKAIQGDYGSDGFTEGGMASGFRSLGATIPGLAAAVATGIPQFALGMGAGVAGGQAMGKAHDAGASSARALTYGIEDAGAEYLTEMLPMGLLLKDIKAGSSFTKLIGHQMATEVPGEVAATAWQNANEWLNLHPEKSMGDYVKELGPDEGQTIIATVVQTLATGGLAHGAMRLQRRGDEKQAKVEQAVQDFATLQTASEHAKSSQTRDLAPDDFKQFVNSVTEDGHLANVYVNGEVFAQSMQAAGVGMEELQKTMPEVASQLQEAIQTQGDVNISTADYLTHIAAGKLGDTLLQHLKVEPDGMTKAEADAQQQTQAQDMADEAGKEIKEISERAAFDNSKKAVYDQVLAQHNEAGRFSPEANKVNAKIYSEMIGTLAQDHGITPEEFHAQHGQTLVGAGSGVFEQESTERVSDSMDRPAMTSIGDFNPHDADILHQAYNANKGEDHAYTHDLFGNPLPGDEGGISTGRGRTRSAKPAVSGDPKSGTYATKTKLVQEGTRTLGAAKVTTPEEAAHATAYLGKGTVERFDALVTDKNGKPLAVVGGFKGDIASAQIYPSTVLGEAFRVEGAANIWFSHNHPGGTNELSDADHRLNQALSEAFKGSGIAPRGMLAIASAKGGKQRWGHSDDLSGGINETGVTHNVPFMERQFTDTGTLGEAISSPALAKVAADKISNGESGVLLLNSQNEPVGFIPVEAGDTLPLRVPGSGRMDALYRGISMANGHRSMIVAHGDYSREQIDNLAGFLNSTGARVLDIFETRPNGAVVAWAEGYNRFDGSTFEQQSRGFYVPDSRTIGLLKNADLSTYIHETGHWALDTYAKIASQPDAPVKMQDDMTKLLNWFGVESLEKWNSMTLEEQRPHHEQLARGFEAYFMEGKAPSLELQPAFSRIKSWMMSIYKTLRGLNVELTPEVRTVFDRMLASEDAIKEAEAARGYFMPETKPAGVSDTAWQELKDLHEAATSEATDEMQARSLRDMKWGSNAKSKMIRKLQREADAQRAVIREAVEKEVSAMPIYRAETWLRKGETTTLDGEVIKLEADAVKGAKFNKEDIAQMYPETMNARPNLDALKGLVSPSGMSPDMIADVFGFSSGDALVRDLLEMEPRESVIEVMTDQRMLEEHGDLIDARAIEQAANEAIHNELRAKFMATGLKMLSRSPISARTIQKGAKEAADVAVAAKVVRNLKPKQYEAAEAKANREALKLVATDPAGAVRAQRSAVLNNALVKSTNEALTDVQKLVEYGKRLETNAAQKNMRGEMLAQMNALLGRFDLRTSVTQPEANRKPIGQWVQEEADRLSAVTPEIPEWVANESYRTHYRELTVGQVRDLRDTLKQLEFLARREHRQYAAIRAMDFADERGEVLAEIRKHWPDDFDEAGDVLGIEPKFAPKFADAVSKLGDKFAGEFLSPETIITILGGGKFSTVNESLFGRISKRADWKATKLGELYRELKPYYAKYNLQEKVEFARKDIGTAKIGLAITREKAMGVALLHGHVEGRERLRNYGWGDQQQLAIVNLLEDRDLDLVAKMWQIQDEMIWPELEALNKRTRGKSPPKVEAVPFTTASGRTMQGGYSRLKYDGDLDEVAFNHDRLDGIKALVGGTFGKSAKTNQGTSTERKQDVTQRPRLDLGVFASALNESVHDLAYREAVADTMRMLRDKGIMAATKRVVGNEGYRALVNRVEEVATPPMNPSGFVERAIGIARKNTVINLMSGVKTALQNFTGLTPALAELNGGTFGSELAKFYGSKMMERYQFCMDQSEFMRNRFTSFDRDLQKESGRMTLNGSYMPDTSTFLALMGFIDKGVSVPVWNTAFKQGMERFENDAGKAVDYADHVVRQTQGSGREADLAQVMSGHGGWGMLKKAFTMFYSYFNSQLGLLVKHGVIAKLEAKQNPQLATARYAAKFIAIVVLPTILTELLMHGTGPDGEDDDQMMMRYATAFVKYGAGFFPFVRDIVPGVWTKVVNPNGHYFGVKISPIDSAGEGIVEGVKSLKDVATGENDEKDTKHLIMAAGYTFGLPGKLVADTVDGTRAWLSGDAGPQAVVLGPPKK